MKPPSRFAKQYHTSAKLETRINFHERFSTNSYPWNRWIFDHFSFSNDARILELGSGAGNLWLENADRINSDWKIVLSDFSEGMLATAQANLSELNRNFQFKHFGAENIPFGEASFEVVIANHMLYHTEVEQALSEIRRVLKPSGKLFASTNGKGHLKEIDELVVRFRGGSVPIQSVLENFSMDNAPEFLSAHFSAWEIFTQDNSMRVNDAKALVEFCLSLSSATIPAEKQQEFSEFVKQQMEAQNGEFVAAKNSGLIFAS